MPEQQSIIYENLGFERRWLRFEQLLWLLMALMLMAACLGVFGRGRLAKRTVEGSALRVSLEGIARSRSEVEMVAQIDSTRTRSGEFRLLVSGALLNNARILQILPEPANTEASNESATFTFKAAPGEPATVKFVQKVNGIGPAESRISVNGEPGVVLRQYILP